MAAVLVPACALAASPAASQAVPGPQTDLLFELPQIAPSGRLRLGDEGRGVLLHQSVQRGLLGGR